MNRAWTRRQWLGSALPAAALGLAQSFQPAELLPHPPASVRREKLRITGVKVTLSGGEQAASRLEFKEWIDGGACATRQPDASADGLSKAWHIARIAHPKNKLCCPHDWHGGLTTIANAALAAAIPNCLKPELNYTFNPLKEEIFQEPPVVRKGYMDLPRRSGFGLELVPDVARQFPISRDPT